MKLIIILMLILSTGVDIQEANVVEISNISDEPIELFVWFLKVDGRWKFMGSGFVPEKGIMRLTIGEFEYYRYGYTREGSEEVITFTSAKINIE